MTEGTVTEIAGDELPDGWKWTSIGIHYAFKNGLNKAKRFFGQGTPIINYMDVFRYQRLSAAHVQGKVTVTNDEADAYSALKGDAFFTRTSETVTEIGYSAVLLEPIQRAVFSGFVLRGRPKNKDLLLNFAAYALRARGVRKQIESRATYTTRALTNGGSLSECVFPLPKEPEQKAIAQALSDIDDLIASLDALIAKKRDIKQGAMQQLLTGKRRLPGFSGEWATVPFRQTLRVRHGKSQKQVEVESGIYPILATGGEIGRSNTPLYDKPSALIGRKGTIDRPQYIDTPFWSVDTLFYTEILRGYNPKYIYYAFQRIDWRGYNEASGVPSLNAKTIEDIEVALPEEPEQTAIVAVLDVMEDEIAAAEEKRGKLAMLRQGMMQQLLTGRIRLL